MWLLQERLSALQPKVSLGLTLELHTISIFLLTFTSPERQEWQVEIKKSVNSLGRLVSCYWGFGKKWMCHVVWKRKENEEWPTSSVLSGIWEERKADCKCGGLFSVGPSKASPWFHFPTQPEADLNASPHQDRSTGKYSLMIWGSNTLYKRAPFLTPSPVPLTSVPPLWLPAPPSLRPVLAWPLHSLLSHHCALDHTWAQHPWSPSGRVLS
jgi:hypothetical protein